MIIQSGYKVRRHQALFLLKVNMEVTANKIKDDLDRQLKSAAEKDVESVKYHPSHAEMLMYCRLHMKNGFIIEGSALLLPGTIVSSARDKARINALKTLATIEQYILADDLYIEAQLGCGENNLVKQSKKGLKNG